MAESSFEELAPSVGTESENCLFTIAKHGMLDLVPVRIITRVLFAVTSAARKFVFIAGVEARTK